VVLPVGLSAVTNEVVEDIDGDPPRGATGGSAISTTEVVEDINGGPPVGCCR
jgi:hypothetical protein